MLARHPGKLAPLIRPTDLLSSRRMSQRGSVKRGKVGYSPTDATLSELHGRAIRSQKRGASWTHSAWDHRDPMWSGCSAHLLSAASVRERLTETSGRQRKQPYSRFKKARGWWPT